MATLRFEAFYSQAIAPRLAKLFRDSIREVIGVQAPVRLLPSGHIVATTPATPGAPPRKVSGRLWTSVQARGNKVYVLAPYGEFLEKDNHRFIALAKAEMQRRTRSANARITT